MNTPFELKDIEDVRIIIKAKGKHYSIMPNKDVVTDEIGRAQRRSCLHLLMESHVIVEPSLEEIKVE
jgi:hypothetical protein